MNPHICKMPLHKQNIHTIFSLAKNKQTKIDDCLLRVRQISVRALLHQPTKHTIMLYLLFAHTNETWVLSFDLNFIIIVQSTNQCVSKIKHARWKILYFCFVHCWTENTLFFKPYSYISVRRNYRQIIYREIIGLKFSEAIVSKILY